MVNPGAFSGTRREFLDSQKEVYAAAVAANHTADTVSDIQRKYFKRYPISLPHDQEPTDEWLAQVDDNAPDPELKYPSEDGMDAAEHAKAVREYLDLVKDIKARKDQIKRRLQYQYNKSRDETVSRERGGSSDPMKVLMARLTGIGIKKPRMRTPYNIWGPEHRYFVDPVFDQRVKEKNVPAKHQAALRSAVYKELFDELPDEEKKEWARRAESEHHELVEEIERKMKAPPSTEPGDRQRVIQSLTKFVEPILDLIADHTGWKVSLIAGGPEPADGGRLNMVSIHSGATAGSVKMNFGRSERRAYKEYVIPTFGSFLKKCYSIEECRARALPNDAEAATLATLSMDEDIDCHRFDLLRTHINVAAPRPSPCGFLFGAPSKATQDNQSGTRKSSLSSTPTPSPPVKFGPPKGAKKRIPPTRGSSTSVQQTPAVDVFPSTVPLEGGDLAPTSTPPAPVDTSITRLITIDGTHCDQALPASSSTPLQPIPDIAAETASSSLPVEPETTDSAPRSCCPTPIPSRAPSPAYSRNDAYTVPLEVPGQLTEGSTSPTSAVRALPPVDNASAIARPCTSATQSLVACTPTITSPSVPLPLPPFTAEVSTSSATAHTPISVSLDAASATSPSTPTSATTMRAAVLINGTSMTPPPVTTTAPQSALSTANTVRSPTSTAPSVTSAASLPQTTPSTPNAANATSATSDLVAAPASTTHHAAKAAATMPDPTSKVHPSPSTIRGLTNRASPSHLSDSLDIRARSILAPSASAPVTSRPPGCTTVPDPSSISAPAAAKSRKRKGAEGHDGNDSTSVSKRLRSSAPTASEKRKASTEGAGSKPKKQRCAQDVAMLAFEVAVPDACPTWLSNAVALVAAVDLGDQWKAVVAAWLKFEQVAVDAEGLMLGTKHRPKVVADWIQRARPPKYRPDVKNLKSFETNFKLWWAGLQPSWRRVAGEDELQKGAGEWDVLHRSGQNGLVSVLAALFFWGLAVLDNINSKKAWVNAVDDVLYALTNMV